jgi:hypothetical protein
MRILHGVSLLVVLATALVLVPSPAAAELKVSIGGYIKLNAFQDQINRAGRLRIAPSDNDVVFDEGGKGAGPRRSCAASRTRSPQRSTIKPVDAASET